jgi:hypothetical protein
MKLRSNFQVCDSYSLNCSLFNPIDWISLEAMRWCWLDDEADPRRGWKWRNVSKFRFGRNLSNALYLSSLCRRPSFSFPPAALIVLNHPSSQYAARHVYVIYSTQAGSCSRKQRPLSSLVPDWRVASIPKASDDTGGRSVVRPLTVTLSPAGV